MILLLVAGLSLLFGFQMFRILLATTFLRAIRKPFFERALLLSLIKSALYLMILFVIFFEAFVSGRELYQMYLLFILMQCFALVLYVTFPLREIKSIQFQKSLFKPNFIFSVKKPFRLQIIKIGEFVAIIFFVIAFFFFCISYAVAL